jgi:fructuronate reductase
MERLSLGCIDRLPAPARPTVDPRQLSVGVVHFGTGAFHRAHQAVYTQRAMAASGQLGWAISGNTQRSPAVADLLRPQDCLYSVTEIDGCSACTTVISAVREVFYAQEQWPEVSGRLADPAVAVVTTTVSEKGYHMHPSARRLRLDDPEVVADSHGRPPRTVVGQLVAGLDRRRAATGAPATVLCCDNMPGNGATLRQLVLDFCEIAPAAASTGLASWVGDNVAFPNTVVDRIVPAPTDDDRRRAATALGLEDHAAVVTEPFSQWVIEDRFAAGRPPWERAGALLVPDARPYEQMKLRLLNGSHSALAYLGALAGHGYLADAARAPGFAEYLRAFMDLDVSPTLEVPAGFDLDRYKQSLLDRFANPGLRYRTSQIAMDGTQKLPYRLLSTVAERLQAGAEPRYACLAVAAWARYVSAGADDTGRPIKVEDPLWPTLRAAAQGAQGPAGLVDRLLALREVFPADLAEDARFRRWVLYGVSALAKHGAAQVVGAAVAGNFDNG